MRRGPRFVIGVVALLAGCSFPFIGLALGEESGAGPWGFFALGGVCLVVAAACFFPGTWPITLRIIGVVVFLAYVVYVAVSVNTPNLGKAVKGLLTIGFPFGVMALFARYPRWARGADALRAEEDGPSPGPTSRA